MIDYLERRKTQDQALTDMVRGRNVDDEISGIRGSMDTSRSRFLGGLDKRISGITGSGSQVFQRLPESTRKTESDLAMRKMQAQRAKYNMVFNTAMDQAENAGMDVRSATAYARKVADQQTQQKFAASEAEKERQYKLKMNTMSNEYADKGVALNDQYKPDMDYTGAFLRILLGTGTAIGTQAYLQNAYAKRLNTQNQTQTYTQSPVDTGRTQGPNLYDPKKIGGY